MSDAPLGNLQTNYGRIFGMNMEQRYLHMEAIHKLEGLLAHAVEHGEFEEAQRLWEELDKLVDEM